MMLFYDIFERVYRGGCRQSFHEIHVGPIDEFHADSDILFWVIDIHVEIYSNVKGLLLQIGQANPGCAFASSLDQKSDR